MHAVEELFISIENADYFVKEDVGSFLATVVASRAADWPYTVKVVTADGSAVGEQDRCNMHTCMYRHKTLQPSYPVYNAPIARFENNMTCS